MAPNGKVSSYHHHITSYHHSHSQIMEKSRAVSTTHIQDNHTITDISLPASSRSLNFVGKVPAVRSTCYMNNIDWLYLNWIKIIVQYMTTIGYCEVSLTAGIYFIVAHMTHDVTTKLFRTTIHKQ